MFTRLPVRCVKDLVLGEVIIASLKKRFSKKKVALNFKVKNLLKEQHFVEVTSAEINL